jgi:hypothetical protein
MAGPCDSPKEVTVNKVPKVLPDMDFPGAIELLESLPQPINLIPYSITSSLHHSNTRQ